MKDILEIRFHGRGGQGAKTAAQLLADAALEGGKHIQSFPEYGPERGGAPIRAFTRISEKEITIHCGSTEPGIVAVIDRTLISSQNVTEGLGKDGILVVNTCEPAKKVRQDTAFKGKIFTVDATQISLDTLGRNMPNMPILGAILKASNVVPLDILEKKVRHKFLKKIGEDATNKNIEAINRAFKEVQEG